MANWKLCLSWALVLLASTLNAEKIESHKDGAPLHAIHSGKHDMKTDAMAKAISASATIEQLSDGQPIVPATHASQIRCVCTKTATVTHCPHGVSTRTSSKHPNPKSPGPYSKPHTSALPQSSAMHKSPKPTGLWAAATAMLTESPAPKTTGKLSGQKLRIMALGGAVTYGVGSSDGNGYRAFLQRLLDVAHVNVTFIGSQHAGNMGDNAVEAEPGASLADLKGLAQRSINQHPNVVLLGADDAASAPAASDGAVLGQLVNWLIATEPEALVLVATPTGKRKYGPSQHFAVDETKGKGAKVMRVSVPLFNVTSPSDSDYDAIQLQYTLAALSFYDQLRRAARAGWIAEPVSQ